MDSIPFYLSYTALWVLVILHSLVLLGMVRIVYQLQQNGAIGHNTNISAGQKAPTFSATDLMGTPVNSADFADRLTALLFVSPDCSSCNQVLQEDMAYLKHKAHGHVIVVCRAERQACLQLAEQYGLDVPIVADEEEHISHLYRISTVPTTVLINDNRIQSYGQPNGQELDKIIGQEPEAAIPGNYDDDEGYS